MISKAAEKVMTHGGVLGPKGTEEVEAVRSVVAALMHELECILHEYLSYNWDRCADGLYEKRFNTLIFLFNFLRLNILRSKI